MCPKNGRMTMSIRLKSVSGISRSIIHRSLLKQFSVIIEDAASDLRPGVVAGSFQPVMDQPLAQRLVFQQASDGKGQGLAVARGYEQAIDAIMHDRCIALDISC